MEIEDIAKTGGVAATIMTIVGAIIAAIKKFNNKKCYSSCCGKEMDVIVAVNELTEEEKKHTPRSSPHIKAIEQKGIICDNIEI